jgi:histidine triad (HIT) family protein
MGIKKLAVQILYHLVGSPVGISIILWSIRHMSRFIPIKVLRETSRLIAFNHPKPAYPIHIIIMPKRPIERLMDLTEADSELLFEVVQIAQSLVEQLQDSGYRLVVNGGEYQTVDQLHFHLVSGELAE